MSAAEGASVANADAGESSDSESFLQKLIDEFGSSLEESLIRAIALDYDVVSEYETARLSLAALAESAAEEQATGFDSTGLSSPHDLDGHLSERTTDPSKVPSRPSTAFSAGGASTIPSESPDFFDEDEDDAARLVGMFPMFPRHTVEFLLKEAKGDLTDAYDALLVRQFLKETNQLPRGVDGFYVDEFQPVHNKGRHRNKSDKKGKGQVTQLVLDYSVTPDESVAYDEIVSADGAVKLSSKTKNKQAPHSVASPTALLHGGLSSPFSPPPLSPRPLVLPLQPKVKITPDGFTVVEHKNKKKTGSSMSSEESVTDYRGRGMEDMRQAATLARQSNSWMRQGAVVYAERGRENLGFARQSELLQADQRVTQQSKPGEVDLHGVTVDDGVRIAMQRAQQWWDGLDLEQRQKRARLEGLTIITGIGNHSSKTGLSRLRQEVGRALMVNGWRFSTLTGQFHVTGKGRS